MKIVNKFQQGGAMPVDAPAPEAAPAGAQQDPMAMIVELFVNGLQNQDCQALAQGAEMFLSLIQQAQAPAPVDAAPQGQPVFRKGGKMYRK
jgi:hypothetical protein